MVPKKYKDVEEVKKKLESLYLSRAEDLPLEKGEKYTPLPRPANMDEGLPSRGVHPFTSSR